VGFGEGVYWGSLKIGLKKDGWMIAHTSVFPYVFGLLLVISVGNGLLRFGRGRRLGPALLKATNGFRWFAGVFLLLFLSEIFDYLNGESIGWAWLRAGVYGTAAVAGLFSKDFSIHSEGMVIGTTVVFWSELEGWSWDSGKRTLLVWSSSWWVRAMSLRPVSGLNTGQAKTEELEALLERFAGGAKRCV